MSFSAFHRASFCRKSRRASLRRLVTGLLTAVVATMGIATTALAEPYLLGPEDKLKIRVYDWRASSSEVHEWAALTGEFVVGASGNVSLPLIGEVPAAILTNFRQQIELDRDAAAEGQPRSAVGL